MEFGTPARKKSKLPLTLAITLIIILTAVAGFFFWKWQTAEANPAAEAQAASQRIIQKVGKLYALPSGEEPTVALVQDKEKLKDQSFFEKAQNGDHLLMYSKAKLALIYREKDNKLINVGPISINNTNDESQQDKSKTSPDIIP